MTEPNDQTTSRNAGRRGRPRPSAGSPGSGTDPRGSRGLIVIGIATVVALALAGAALFLQLTRPTTGADTSCRSVAWRALPETATLPAGWSMVASGFYTDGFGASFVGPAASADPSTGAGATPSASIRVSCFGDDSHLALIRSRDGDLAAGGTEVPFADLGDEVVATQDANGASTSVYIRRGPLVASVAASGAMDPAELERVARAVDDAMGAAQSGTAAAAPTSDVGPVASAGEPSDGAPTDGTPSDGTPSDGADSPVPATHDVPDLERLLPTTVGGTALVTQSTKGVQGLSSDDAWQALLAKLTALGKKGSDVDLADAYDESGVVDLDIVALRLKGLTAAQLRDAVTKSWLTAGPGGATAKEQTIGGRKVTVIDYGDGTARDYVWDQGDVVFDMLTADPAIAEKVLSGAK